MDYNLAALKLLCRQLKDAKPAATDSSAAFSLAGVLFQRVWLQGVLVSSDPCDAARFLLDDGTAVIDITIHSDHCKRDWNPGMYVMVVGNYYFSEDDLPTVKAHKIVDLSPYPDREAMWYLEVIEAYKMFYQPSFD